MSLARRSVLLLALQVAMQARALVQVPLLTRTLSPDAFGSLTLALWIAGAAGALGALGLQTGFYLQLVRVDGPRTRAAITSVLALSLPVVAALSLTTAFCLAAGYGSRWLPGLAELAGPLGLLMAGTALREIVLVVPRARQHVAVFAAANLWMHYGGLALGAALLFAGHGLRGFLFGLAAGVITGAAAVAAHAFWRAEGRLAWDSEFVRQVLCAAGPVVPLALAHMSLLSLDYVFVSRYLGPAALATYALAYTFASPVLLAVAVNNFTLLPEYATRHRQGEPVLASFVERLLATGWTVGLLLVAVAAAVGPVLVELIAGPAYRDAGRLLPVIVASYVLFVLAQMQHLVRAALVASVAATAGVALSCALLNALANMWVVPAYGTRGAALATLASFLLYYQGMCWIVRPLVNVSWRAMQPLGALAALVLGSAVLLLAPEPMPTVAVVSLAAVALSRLGRLVRPT